MADGTTRRRGRAALHPRGETVTRRKVGPARPRMRIERPVGLFALRAGLDAPGAIPLALALDLVCVDWDRQVEAGTVGSDVIRDYAKAARSLVRFATSRGLATLGEVDTDLLFEWINARHASDPNKPVTRNTKYQRRSAARAFFMTAMCLGLHDQNPALPIEFPSRYERYVAAFTDAHIALLKNNAPYQLGETKMPSVLALTLLGASSGEVAYVRIRDVDLDQRRVWVHDGGQRTPNRWLPIDDDWALEALTRRLDHLGPGSRERFVTYESRGGQDTPARRSAATGVILLRLLQMARVHEPGKTRGESIREWLALKVFRETGRVEAVAARLGMSSLDAAAHLVGYDWATDYRLPGDPP